MDLERSILCFILVYCTGLAWCYKEKRLVTELLKRYKSVGRIGRPVNNTADTIAVEYGLSLIQILELDERNQILTTNVWGNYKWRDELLTWNPADHGNVTSVRVPKQLIWMPDIKLYNYADERLEELRDASVVVYSDGSILWVPQGVYKSSCSIDITYFPFDIQTCAMKFGSWTYDGFAVDLFFFGNYSGFDLSDYVKSNEWEVLSHTANKTVKYYQCCPEPYPDLTFTLILQRKVAFYNYILILPCVLLSSLTLVLFWLPPESPAKMQLGMNIFVAFFVLLLLLAESTPPAASNIPLIGAYYCLNMVLITMSTFLSVVVVNLYFHGTRSRVPRIVKTIMISIMARILCMRALVRNVEYGITSSSEKLHNNQLNPEQPQQQQLSKSPRSPFTYDTVNRHCDKITNSEEHRRLVPNGTQGRNMEWEPQGDVTRNPFGSLEISDQLESIQAEVRMIRRQLGSVTDKISSKEADDSIGREWKVIALVLDRIFFFLYLICILVSVFTVFPKARNSSILPS